MRTGLTAVVAVLALAACGSSDRVELRAVAPSTTTTAALRGDAIRYMPRPVPTTPATRPVPTTRASRSSGVRLIPPAERRQVASTAYCETGTMANGERTYDGAVAMGTKKNPEPPFGTRFRVLSGPFAGRTLTVADRIGHGSQFDIAMPGRCPAALEYGRKQITVERVG